MKRIAVATVLCLVYSSISSPVYSEETKLKFTIAEHLELLRRAVEAALAQDPSIPAEKRLTGNVSGGDLYHCHVTLHASGERAGEVAGIITHGHEWDGKRINYPYTALRHEGEVPKGVEKKNNYNTWTPADPALPSVEIFDLPDDGLNIRGFKWSWPPLPGDPPGARMNGAYAPEAEVALGLPREALVNPEGGQIMFRLLGEGREPLSLEEIPFEISAESKILQLAAKV